MRNFILSIIILLISVSACSSSGIKASGGDLSAADRAAQLAKLDYPGFKSDGLDPYAATFEIRFDGSYSWSYVLRVRFDGQHTEYRMEYLGLDSAEDPGAVRMVSDGTTSRMLGASTDNLCFLFPSGFDTDLPFFNPDDILDPFFANEGLEQVGSDELAGMTAEHYSAQNNKLGKWDDVQVDIWIDEDNRATLLYEMGANGGDPFFKAGEGHISINYLVKEFATQIIEPITPCPIPVPLPDDASEIASFPGLVSFDSNLSSEEIITFYQSRLPLESWLQVGTVEYSDNAALMGFKRGEENMQINIEIKSSGVNVEILIQ
ncbi:MAG: hypothetical protein N2C13_03735 [Chloroflexota bacterium]